jgi:hypothetical protein
MNAIALQWAFVCLIIVFGLVMLYAAAYPEPELGIK